MLKIDRVLPWGGGCTMPAVGSSVRSETVARLTPTARTRTHTHAHTHVPPSKRGGDNSKKKGTKRCPRRRQRQPFRLAPAPSPLSPSPHTTHDAVSASAPLHLPARPPPPSLRPFWLRRSRPAGLAPRLRRNVTSCRSYAVDARALSRFGAELCLLLSRSALPRDA